MRRERRDRWEREMMIGKDDEEEDDEKGDEGE